MKDLRNPLTRTENFEHPSGNIMKELTEKESPQNKRIFVYTKHVAGGVG